MTMKSIVVQTIITLMLLFPLVGAIFQMLSAGRGPRRVAEAVACAAVLASLAMAAAGAVAAWGQACDFVLLPWFSVGDFVVGMDVHYDALAAAMALMVTFVAGLIHLYSIFYLAPDTGHARYFCYLNLFVFFMLVIVCANNLIFLLLGWEGVGFCSYALISFWYQDAANGAAGRKAFLLTRIGDVGLFIAIGLLFAGLGSITISEINARAASLAGPAALLIGGLLLWSAIGKSAQLPLLVWLPDAMAGPTPVSALIHAATMVVAGVYLLLRLFPIITLSSQLMQTIAAIGTLTALYGAAAALAQRDIKRLLAYSTISQIGFLFLAVGVGDIIGGTYHLLIHAFFKSLLFLAAGCVIHSLHGERDIFQMGRELWRRMPAVFMLFLAGSLALASVPPSAGFFSKGRILLAAALPSNPINKTLWLAATLAAFLTALYSSRMVLLTFFGRPVEGRSPDMASIPRPVVWLLWPLALLALGGGMLNLGSLEGGAGWLARWLAQAPGAISDLAAPPRVQYQVESIDKVSAFAGLALAYFLYGPNAPGRYRLAGVLASGLRLDSLYETVFAKPYRNLARLLWISIDEGTLDRGILRGAGLFSMFASGLRRWTTGRISTSLTMLLVGFTVILIFLTI